MKFHWGHGIAAFYSLFALSLIVAVIKSTAFDNSLVAEDYYARDIAYQSIMDKKSNSLALDQSVQFNTKGGLYELTMPVAAFSGELSGSVQLYCPTTADRDLHWPLELTEDGSQIIPLLALPKGHYKLIVDWTAEGKGYLDEFEFYHSK